MSVYTKNISDKGWNLHWNLAFILILSSWLLYWRYVLKNKSLEKLTLILEFKEKKSADENGSGNLRLLSNDLAQIYYLFSFALPVINKKSLKNKTL